MSKPRYEPTTPDSHRRGDRRFTQNLTNLTRILALVTAGLSPSSLTSSSNSLHALSLSVPAPHRSRAPPQPSRACACARAVTSLPCVPSCARTQHMMRGTTRLASSHVLSTHARAVGTLHSSKSPPSPPYSSLRCRAVQLQAGGVV